MRYTITHLTEYRYDVPVAVSHNAARVRPRPLPHQRIVSQDVLIDPACGRRSRFVDYFGNEVDYFELRNPVEVLRVRAVTVVDRTAPVVSELAKRPWQEVARTNDPEAAEFRLDSPFVRRNEEFRAYAISSFPRARPIGEGLAELTSRIHEDFQFDPNATHVNTPVEDVLRTRAGVCQDFAHVAIACLRSIGLSARYTSGFLRTIPPPGEERLVGADATHAWLAVHIGNDEWLGADPTNDVSPADEHVTIGWGRDYSDVPPVRGVRVGGGGAELTVSVDVAPES